MVAKQKVTPFVKWLFRCESNMVRKGSAETPFQAKAAGLTGGFYGPLSGLSRPHSGSATYFSFALESREPFLSSLSGSRNTEAESTHVRSAQETNCHAIPGSSAASHHCACDGV